MHFAKTASGTAAVFALVAIAVPSGSVSLLGSLAPHATLMARNSAQSLSLPDMERRITVAKRGSSQPNARADLAPTGPVSRLLSIMARTTHQPVSFSDMESRIAVAKRASSQLKARGEGLTPEPASPKSTHGENSNAHLSHPSPIRAHPPAPVSPSGGFVGHGLERPLDHALSDELPLSRPAESPSHGGSGRELTAPLPAESPSYGGSGRAASGSHLHGPLLGTPTRTRTDDPCAQCFWGCLGCCKNCIRLFGNSHKM